MVLTMETGTMDIGIGRIVKCTNCNNTGREVVKQEFFNQDAFYIIPLNRQTGKVFVVCHICHWGIKLNPKIDSAKIEAIIWDGREQTKAFLNRISSSQRNRILKSYRKMGLNKLVNFMSQ